MYAASAPAYFVSHGTALHTLDPLGGPLAALRAEGARSLRGVGARQCDELHCALEDGVG